MTRFRVRSSFLGSYETHQVGGRDVVEHWIRLNELNDLWLIGLVGDNR